MRFYFFILLLINCTNASFKQDDKEDVIVWQKNRRLTWNDYQGKPQRRFAAASTVYSMYRHVYKDADGNIIASIKAMFYPKDSWRKNSWIDDALLAHEQRHFDIVELYARKLRKQLMQIKVRDEEDAQQKLDSLHKIIDADMDAYQDKYDEKTNYSMAHDEQAAWIKAIDTAIEKLSAYQNTEVKLKPAF